MLGGIQGADAMADRFPVERFSTFRARMAEMEHYAQLRRKNRGAESAATFRKMRRQLNKDARTAMMGWMAQTMQRRTHSETAFRERIVSFWADHFTAYGKRGLVRRATSPYIEDAIRPHISGTFEDLLQSAVMHPLMLDFLDQSKSIGPNSGKAYRMGAKKAPGLNENLAREVLELHTLGVDGPYGQQDVTELAELFTGMTFEARNGFKFRKDFAEPGAETVLGITYSERADVNAVRNVLADLAAHPATARHLAWKLAVHFVADTPDPDLIDAIEAAYRDSAGSLDAMYEALLTHPAAWDATLSNYKPPVDFISSTLRGLGVPGDTFETYREGQLRRLFRLPLLQMGQAWEQPIGPDGWAEADAEWITPQGLAARVGWAMAAPETVVGELPDPRVFVDTALGHYANDAVRFAAAAAESKPEAIGIVLMSPAFQRR